MCVHDEYLECTWAGVQHDEPEKNETTYPLQPLHQFSGESAINLPDGDPQTGNQRTKILQLQKPAIFAFSTRNCALFGYLNSILSISR
jgi:hypothetical protein